MTHGHESPPTPGTPSDPKETVAKQSGHLNDYAEDEAAIRALIGDWAGSVRRRDMAGILASHAPEILMFDVPLPFVSRGIKAYEATWDLFFSESDFGGVFEIDSLEITVGETVAFAAAIMRCGTPDKSGPNGQLQFRLTVGLRKIAGKWTVVHEHHSIPAASEGGQV
jgi:ketosteroid isomerase-like protein